VRYRRQCLWYCMLHTPQQEKVQNCANDVCSSVKSSHFKYSRRNHFWQKLILVVQTSSLSVGLLTDPLFSWWWRYILWRLKVTIFVININDVALLNVISALWVSLAIWDHNVTYHPTQVNTPRLNPSQRGWYSIHLPCRRCMGWNSATQPGDRRLSWPRWLVTYWDSLPTPVGKWLPVHPSTNPAAHGRESDATCWLQIRRSWVNHYTTKPPIWSKF